MAATRHLLLILLGAAIAGNTTAAAQDSASLQAAQRSAEEASAVGQYTAPVTIDGVTLFHVRGIFSYPAERRAAEIAGRIRDVASDRSVPIQSLVVEETPLASVIVASGHRVLAMVNADAELEGVTRQVLAQAYQRRIAEAVATYRHDREPAVIWRDIARAAMATVALALAFALGIRLLRRLRAYLNRLCEPRIRDVELRTFAIVRGEHLWRGGRRIARATVTLVALIAAYVYLDYVLLLFPWTRALGRSLSGMLLQPLATLGTGILRFIPDLFFLIILVVVTRYALELLRLFFRRVGDGTITLRGFEREWAMPVDRILRLLAIAAALVIAYPHIPGSESEAFKGIGLVIGLMISLGSPSVVGNAIAGFSLLFRRAFKVGDRVRIGEHLGDVTQVRMLTTYLRSPKNEQITIPNSLILNSEVVNYSTLASERGLILHTNVGIGYEAPWRQVEAMLLEAARRTPGLLSRPVPFVLQRALGDFAVNYELNAACDNPQAMLQLYSALHRNVLDVFNEYGVQIMTPAYEGDPEHPKIVPRTQWFAAPAKANPAESGVDRAASAAAPAPADLTSRPESDGRPLPQP